MNGREDRIIFMKKKNIVFVLCLIFALGFLFMPQEGRNAEAASRTRLSSTSLKVVPGKTEKLRIYGRRGRKVVWTSSRPRVVSVENGKLTALKGGTSTITARVGSQKLHCKVRVVGLNTTKITLAKGDKFQLKVKNGYRTTWTSKNKKIAKVSKNGVIKAKKSGVTTIVCRTNGRKLKCKVYVASLEYSTLRLKAESSYHLSIKHAGDVLAWTSSNPSVAEVDSNGNITTLPVSGTSVLTCKSGKAVLSCKLTVVSPDNIITNMSTLPTSSNQERFTVTVNSYPNVRHYTVYRQSASINASSFKNYMPYHGCAACAAATVLTGFGKNITPKRVTDKNGLEYKAFGKKIWKKNYKKELKDQMPVSLYGINKIFNNNGIQTEYVRRFSDVEACQQIISHLKTGNPVVIEAKKGKWANSYHTMVLLGLTDTGKAIIADSANRTRFGSKQRVKYESVSNLIKHMFACSVSGAKSANCYFGSSSGGGYILVNPNP